MRLLIAFAVIFFIYLPSVSADNAVDIKSPATMSVLASKSLLLDISSIGEDKLVAVGQHGHILLSSDGEEWQQANVPVQATLTSVYFLNEQLGWAVGHDATILHSQDGGLNWQLQQYLPSLEKPLLDIYFKNANHGIAVGAYGQFFRTHDGGKSWNTEFHQTFLFADDIEYLNELKQEDEELYLDEISFILPHFNRIVNEGETVFILGETGLLAKSNDFGLTWQQFDNFYQGSFFSLARTKKGNLLVAGLRGHVFRGLKKNLTVGVGSDINNVIQWDEVATNITALLNDIVVADDGRIFILGNNGALLVSNNDGQFFNKVPQKDGKPLIAGVWFKNRLFAVSDIGIKIIDLPK